MTKCKCALMMVLLILAATQPTYAQNWTDITPVAGPMPPARTHADAIYDIVRHRMIVFGGSSATGNLNDLWSFDLTTHTWTDITPASGPAPAARLTPITVLDSAGNQMLMWSGQGAVFFNDVWAFELTTEIWSEFAPPNPVPNIRYGVASVFDPVMRELVTFAGFTNLGRFDDTWRFSPDSIKWRDVSPIAGNPAARCLHSASYDAMGHRMIMYGGQNNLGALGDTWAFNLADNSWTILFPTNSPPGRFFTTHIYAAPIHHIVLFGGNVVSSKTNEVWGLDLGTDAWQQFTPSGTPPIARDGAVGVYVESEDRLIVFGGQGSVHLNDVWALNNVSSAVSIADEKALRPRAFDLLQNVPNPFNPSTRISFSLSEPSHVLLTVYSIIGQKVATLASAPYEAGNHWLAWDGRDEFGHPVSSGVYFYHLSTRHGAETRKMLLLR